MLEYIEELVKKSEFFKDIADALINNPPQQGNSEIRRNVFNKLDFIFQNNNLTGKDKEFDIGSYNHQGNGLVEGFYNMMLEKAIYEIETEEVNNNLIFWNIYNAGFYIKTNKVRFAIDLTIGIRPNWWKINQDLIARLIDSIDILFITHSIDNTNPNYSTVHGDHYDPRIVKGVLKKGNPVIMNRLILEKKDLHLLQLNEEEIKKVIWINPDSKITIKELNIYAFQGLHVYRNNLDVLPHLSYEIETPLGITLYHTGDLDYTQKNPQLGIKVSGKNKIDILFMKYGGVSPKYDDQNPYDFGDDNEAFILGYSKFNPSPSLVIPTHLAELGHEIGGGRECYLNVYKLPNSIPYIIMTWGEKIDFSLSK